MVDIQVQKIIFFSGSAIIFLTGFYVFLKDPKRSLNKIFFIFSLAAVCWGMFDGLLRVVYPSYISLLSIQAREAIIEKIGPEATKIILLKDLELLGALSLSGLFLHLCLITLERKEILKRKIFYFLVYFPPLLRFFFFLIDDLCPQLRKLEFFKTFLSFLNFFTFLYFDFLLLIAFFLLSKEFISSKSSLKRLKLMFYLIGASIPAIPGSIFSVFLPIFYSNETFQWMTFPLYIFGYFVAAIGILRYGLLIDYREILENIFRELAELVIVADKEGIVLLTNEITLSKLNFKEEEFIGKDIRDFFKEKEKWKEILEKFKKEKTFKGEISFLTKRKKEIPFLLTASKTRQGVILVGRDIKELVEYQEKLEKEVKKKTEELEEAKTVLEIKVRARTKELKELAEGLEEEVKRRTKELQEKVAELERFQKLAVGRELKMVKLKEEIKRLKEELEKCRGQNQSGIKVNEAKT